MTSISQSLDLDSAEASEVHAELIRSKPFLRRIYEENYQFFATELRDCPAGPRVELGSGGGFINEVIPHTITSDVVSLTGTDLVYSALALPFPDATLSAIMMINVFHHLQDVRLFLREAERTLRPGGKILMIEPANTLLSNFIYSRFHHEPFEPNQVEWELPPGGRMSAANDALPWIVFARDRERFLREFPAFYIDRYENFMPFRYILSGGVSRGQLVPSWSYPLVKGCETLMSPFNNLISLFTRIVVRKR